MHGWRSTQLGSRAPCCVVSCPFTAIGSCAAGRNTWSRAIEVMFDLTTYARLLFRTTERLAGAQAAARSSTATEQDRVNYEHVRAWERNILRSYSSLVFLLPILTAPAVYYSLQVFWLPPGVVALP